MFICHRGVNTNVYTPRPVSDTKQHSPGCNISSEAQLAVHLTVADFG